MMLHYLLTVPALVGAAGSGGSMQTQIDPTYRAQLRYYVCQYQIHRGGEIPLNDESAWNVFANGQTPETLDPGMVNQLHDHARAADVKMEYEFFRIIILTEAGIKVIKCGRYRDMLNAAEFEKKPLENGEYITFDGENRKRVGILMDKEKAEVFDIDGKKTVMVAKELIRHLSCEQQMIRAYQKNLQVQIENDEGEWNSAEYFRFKRWERTVQISDAYPLQEHEIYLEDDDNEEFPTDMHTTRIRPRTPEEIAEMIKSAQSASSSPKPVRTLSEKRKRKYAFPEYRHPRHFKSGFRNPRSPETSDELDGPPRKRQKITKQELKKMVDSLQSNLAHSTSPSSSTGNVI